MNPSWLAKHWDKLCTLRTLSTNCIRGDLVVSTVVLCQSGWRFICCGQLLAKDFFWLGINVPLLTGTLSQLNKPSIESRDLALQRFKIGPVEHFLNLTNPIPQLRTTLFQEYRVRYNRSFYTGEGRGSNRGHRDRTLAQVRPALVL